MAASEASKTDQVRPVTHPGPFLWLQFRRWLSLGILGTASPPATQLTLLAAELTSTPPSAGHPSADSEHLSVGLSRNPRSKAYPWAGLEERPGKFRMKAEETHSDRVMLSANRYQVSGVTGPVCKENDF